MEKLYKTVYIYTTDVKKALGRFKVGKADRWANSPEEAAEIRIKEQFTAGNRDEKIELCHVFNAESIGKLSIDLEKKIHKILRKQGYAVGGEWFETRTTDPIFIAYNDIKYGIARRNEYKLRIEQLFAVNQAYNYYINGGNIFLFNAVMRFGKCFASYMLAKKLNAKRILVLTYKPAVKDSWEADLNHVELEKYEYFDALVNLPKEENKSFVLFSSFQDILGKKLDKEPKDKWAEILKSQFDLVIIDEVHFGFASEKCQKFIKTLNYTYRLDLSGTPINLLSSGYYEEDQVYNWTYIDEQKRKRENPEDENYKWLPRLNLYTYKISEEILQYEDEFDETEKLTLSKFFSANDKYEFYNDAAVEQFLNNLAIPEKRILRSPFNDDEIKKHLNHMFWYLPSVASVKALAKKLKMHNFFKQYKIVIAAADNDGEGSDTLEIVKEAIIKVDKQIGDGKNFIGTITLSCGKLNTGITVPKWNSVFMLSDMQSVQSYWQTGFRGKNPNKEDGKMDSYIFDFNPNRALNMMYSFSQENSKTHESTIKVIREFLDTMSVLSYEGNQLIKLNTEELLQKIVEIGANTLRTIYKFNSDWLINKNSDLLTDEMINILNKVEGTKSAKIENLVISSDETGKGKNFKTISRNGKPLEEKEVKLLINDLVNKARTITSSIPNFLYASESKEESIEDIYITKDKNMFESICGIKTEELKILIESGFINKFRINKAIESFHIIEIKK